MNKGAPAGNMIRKQVGLLPKYQLTMTPIDERTVSIQLKLVNQAHLSDHLDQLTAGEHHKCHVVVGDSENHLLLLTSFSDKDLISVYDGTLTYEIIRKHSFEHKILVHCLSTTFVGVDAQCEYVFKTLEPLYYRGEADIIYPVQDTVTPTRKTAQKQLCITDVYKERKRKNNDNITQSKEKKKRDSALIEQFKHLRESFGIASKVLKNDLNQSAEMSNKILQDSFRSDKSLTANNTREMIKKNDNAGVILGHNNDITTVKEYPKMTIEDVDCDNFMVDERIDNILNEIENEISKSRNSYLIIRNTDTERTQIDTQHQSTVVEPRTESKIINANINQYLTNQSHKTSLKEKRKPNRGSKTFNTKSNYSFIDSIEKKADLSDDEDLIPINDGGFSNTIKYQMEKFLQNTHNVSNQPDVSVKQLIDLTESPTSEVEQEIICANLENSSAVEENQKAINSKPSGCPVVSASNQQNCHSKLVKDQVLIDNEIIEYQEVSKALDKHRRFADNLSKNNEEFATDRDPVASIQHKNNLTENIHDDNLPVTRYETKLKPIDNTYKYDMNTNSDNIPTAIKRKNCIDQIEANDVVWNREANKIKYTDNEIITSTSKDIATPIPIPININMSDYLRGNIRNEDIMFYNDNDKSNMHEIEEFNKTTDSSPKYAVFPFTKIQDNIMDLKSNNAQIDILYDSPMLKNFMNFDEPSIVHVNWDKNSNMNKIDNQNNKIIDICENVIAHIDESITESPKQIYSVSTPWPNQSTTNKEFGTRGETSCSHENDTKSVNESNNSSNEYQAKLENVSLATCVPKLHSDKNIPSLISSHSRPKNINVSTILSENTSNTQQDGYINKYSFTTTKIDVCTKNTHEHKFQIIRRLKLDVDVTEIVSKSNTKAQYNESKQSNTSSNNKTIHLDVLTPINVENNDPKYVKEQHLRDVQTSLPIEYIAVKPKQINEKRNNGNIARTVQSIEHSKGNTVLKTERGNSDDNDDETQCKESGNTNVKNILEKYSTKSTIMSKNNRLVNNNNININTLDKCKESELKIRKLKRPYKISDIHNLDVSLPKTLIVESSRSRPANETILAQIKAKHAVEEKSRMAARSISTTSVGNSKDHGIELILEDIPECPTPMENLLREFSDSPTRDIDQSMFDPNTLLRYCSKEPNEIIPPPLEFCDREGVYSPTQTNDFNLDELPIQENYLEYSPEIVDEGLGNINLEKGHNTNIFEDYHDTLTPSKEIETWTLSCDESWETSELLPSNPTKSCIVMRNNSPRNHTFIPIQNLASRQAKLGHFKFTRKQKLKM